MTSLGCSLQWLCHGVRTRRRRCGSGVWGGARKDCEAPGNFCTLARVADAQ